MGRGVLFFDDSLNLVYLEFDESFTTPSFHTVFTLPPPVPVSNPKREHSTLRVLSPSLILVSEGTGMFYLVQWSAQTPYAKGILVATVDIEHEPLHPNTLLDATFRPAGQGGSDAMVAILGYCFNQLTPNTSAITSSQRPGLGAAATSTYPSVPRRDSQFVVSLSIVAIPSQTYLDGSRALLASIQAFVQCADVPVSGTINADWTGFTVAALGQILELAEADPAFVRPAGTVSSGEDSSAESSAISGKPAGIRISGERSAPMLGDAFATLTTTSLMDEDFADPDIAPLPPFFVSRVSLLPHPHIIQASEPLLSSYLAVGDPHWSPKQMLLQADVDASVWEMRVESDLEQGFVDIAHVANFPALSYLSAGRRDLRFVVWHPWWEYAALVGGGAASAGERGGGLGYLYVYAQPEARSQYAPEWLVDFDLQGLEAGGVAAWDENNLREKSNVKGGGAIGCVWLGDDTVIVLGERVGAVVIVERDGGRSDDSKSGGDSEVNGERMSGLESAVGRVGVADWFGAE
ncbi:hypothetical protein HDU93_007665 [Gonapodya sp. JEL0774]|nr:hypothetical protein HDU93_007665 [Gonapodya sp. JEL0774]